MGVTKTVFKVGDFVSWQKTGQLQLSPKFQRRSVWKKGAKSYLIDTMVRGMPVPIVFLRDKVTVGEITSIREVVDGQQRLRTILSFIDRSLVKDFNEERDSFKVSRTHNKEYGGKLFSELSAEMKQRIIGYEIPVHVFSSDTEDRDVLQIFSRLNSTGMSLNDQELRNADWYGEFKTLCYSLGYQHLNSWEEWDVFKADHIARMREVEEVGDLIVAMHEGLHGKSQKKITDYYEKFDTVYPERQEVTRRFNHVMSVIESTIGTDLPNLEFSSQSLFHCLFLAVYHICYGLTSSLVTKKPAKVPADFPTRITKLSNRLTFGEIPEELAKSLRGAVGDIGTRRQRTEFILDEFKIALPKG